LGQGGERQNLLPMLEKQFSFATEGIVTKTQEDCIALYAEAFDCETDSLSFPFYLPRKRSIIIFWMIQKKKICGF